MKVLKEGIVFVCAIALMAFGVRLAFLGSATGAIVVFGASGMFLIISNADKFVDFEVFGLKTRMRNTLNEADELLEKLRGITFPIAEMLFTTAARSGRYSAHMSRRQGQELVKRIDSELRLCGVSEEQLEKAKADWHFYNIFDLCGPVQAEVSKVFQKYEHSCPI